MRSRFCTFFAGLLFISTYHATAFGQVWQEGEIFTSESGQRYEIVKLLGAGGGGYVYSAHAPSGELVAIKFVRTDIEETPQISEWKEYVRQMLLDITGVDYQGYTFSEIVTIAEHIAMDTALKHGINHAKILEKGDGYAVKQYLEGVTGEDFLEDLDSVAPDDEGIIALKAFVDSMIDKGLCPADFKPSNVMWSNGSWYLIDLLALRESGDPDRARQVFQEEFDDKWSEHMNENLSEDLRNILLGTATHVPSTNKTEDGTPVALPQEWLGCGFR